MKLSYNWLSELVDLHDIDPFDAALRLTMSTAEIEDVQETGDVLEGVVIGRIVDVAPHPDSDHLYLTRVDVGEAVLEIVSGAPNTKKDVFVPVALVGSTLPSGLKVKKVKLRGAVSCGVVCSEKEVGASEDHTGLWILDKDGVEKEKLLPGAAFSSLFPTKDHILEIDNKSITNRPDLWGHYGFARELAAIFRRDLEPLYSEEIYARMKESPGQEPLSVEVHDPDLCPRYTALMLGGIKVGRSPYWLRRRLYTLGVRPINNIVDVTNLVMLETGQPLHAFDASKLTNSTIIVRRARTSETCVTLDGIKRSLDADNLVIADPERAVAIAGVMGGLDSEIDLTTKRIVIESANFDPVSVRKTAFSIGLRTEASNRFEKSIDPELTLSGIGGCVFYLDRLMPSSSISSKLADARDKKKKTVVLGLDPAWASRLLGTEITKDTASDILGRLEFGVETKPDGTLQVTVPTFRATKDVGISHDLVEEIGRIYGYNNIKPVLPAIESTPAEREEELFLIRRTKTILSGEMGLSEVYSYSFQDDAVLRLFYDKERFVTLQNPISSNLSRMRRSIIPGLFSFVEKNFTRNKEFSIFEIGSVYLPSHEETAVKAAVTAALPDEKKLVSALFVRDSGDRAAFFHAKGVLERLFSRLHTDGIEYLGPEAAAGLENSAEYTGFAGRGGFHPGRTAFLCDRGACMGMVAELNPKVLKEAGVDFHTHRIAVFEFDLGRFGVSEREARERRTYTQIPKFPQVALGLACVVEETVPVAEVEDFIRSRKVDLMEDVELFDIYRGKPVPEGKKSIAFNVYYREEDRTLTEEEANRVHETIAEAIRAHGWELR
ncbi:MAG: phenylalanine--tRNA ligase subunit beta [Spirochaetes bacterium]|nr:phenylalanine--tRNA ligase subunit beta [Spirochaetota bacterium]